MSYFGRDFYTNLAMGGYSNIIKWSKLGYCPIPVTTETDIWSYGATTPVVPLIVTAATMRVKTNNAADAATVLFGPTTATGQPVRDQRPARIYHNPIKAGIL